MHSRVNFIVLVRVFCGIMKLLVLVLSICVYGHLCDARRPGKMTLAQGLVASMFKICYSVHNLEWMQQFPPDSDGDLSDNENKPMTVEQEMAAIFNDPNFANSLKEMCNALLNPTLPPLPEAPET